MTTKPVNLSAEERSQLRGLLRRGAAPARVQTRARILLLTDASLGQHRPEGEISRAVLTSLSTVRRTRRRFLAKGVEAALTEKPRPGAPPKITGEIEAHLVLLACSDPPEGRDSWTLRLLADRMVELGHLESISHVAVGKRLKKTQ
jgi:transposase